MNGKFNSKTAQINFISLKPDSDETRATHTRRDNEEFMNGSDTNEIIEEVFEVQILHLMALIFCIMILIK